MNNVPLNVRFIHSEVVIIHAVGEKEERVMHNTPDFSQDGTSVKHDKGSNSILHVNHVFFHNQN